MKYRTSTLPTSTHSMNTHTALLGTAFHTACARHLRFSPFMRVRFMCSGQGHGQGPRVQGFSHHVAALLSALLKSPFSPLCSLRGATLLDTSLWDETSFAITDNEVWLQLEFKRWEDSEDKVWGGLGPRGANP